MKKVYLIIIGLLLVAFPNFVYADQTTKYYIEVDILDNGDANVKELKLMDGIYNGYKTNIRYKSDGLDKFTGKLDNFSESDIYNATGITNLKVYDVKFNSDDFSVINNKINEFSLVSSAKKGDYKVYTKEETNEGFDLLVYLPSSYKRASLVTYTLKNLVVVHNDIAEMAHNFIGNDYEENIKDLIIRIKLPKESKELKIFSHGPLDGSNRIINNQEVEITYDFLIRNNAVDGRVVFDKEIVPNATKKSNVDGMENILKIEKERADIANQERQNLLKIEKEMKRKKNIFAIISGVWFLGLVLVVYRFRKKTKQKYGTEIDSKYFRDFPSDYIPSTVDYLMNKKVGKLSFKAEILELIRKKAIVLEEVMKNEINKKNTSKTYKLSKNPTFNLDELKDSEKIIYDLLINVAGNGEYITLDKLNNYTKIYDNAKKFMEKYDSWHYKSLNEAKSEGFYESISRDKIKAIVYSFLIMWIFIISVILGVASLISFAFNIFGIMAIIYFICSSKRTKLGSEEYFKWKGLKNFLNDFGRLDEKDLPEIKLWEKYLVYATVFGIATKVQKSMKINLDKFNYNDGIEFTYLYVFDFGVTDSIFNSIDSSISSARGVIYAQESSSTGSGGGSSFGGGSFGGGSGGGRF